MQSQQMNVDVISNNLANVNTAGFKRAALQFEDVMYSTPTPPGAPLGDGSVVPSGIQVGHGSKPIATSRSFAQGDMIRTENQLDVSVQGKGFFSITMPDGSTSYTRDGSFKVNQEGQFVTNQGYALEGVAGVDPQATEIVIAADGTVSQVVNGTITQLAPITLTMFPNPEGLRSVGENLYTETEASGAPQAGLVPGQNGTGSLAQGYIESSNVRVVEEMVRLIQAQRAYEVNSKAINASDEMMGIANQLKR
jgi:flagellar basal-body rod protein FlgG